MSVSGLFLRGMACVPGIASGVVYANTRHPDGIALVAQGEAVASGNRVAGLLVVDGAPLSHTMIGLASTGIPTIILDPQQAGLLRPGTRIWLDGATGIVTTERDRLPVSRSALILRAGNPVRLADGTEVKLMASVRNAAQVRQAVLGGASAIGLVRSEFLDHQNSAPPDLEQITHSLESLCAAAGGLPLTVRLMDVAVDKPPRWLDRASDLLRPFGMQGARLFHSEPIRSVVKNQLAALAVLGEQFDLEVLVPYLGKQEEMRYWVSHVRDSLPPKMPVGAMAETPAALLDLASWFDAADFVAIGSNDLMQCLFGADRDEPALRRLLDPYAPVLYRLLDQVIRHAEVRPDRLRICGLLPRFSGVLSILVGLGYRQFSVDPAWLPYLAEDLCELTLTDAEDLAKQACSRKGSKEVCELLGLSHEAVLFG